MEKNVSQLAEESCFAAEDNDKQAVFFFALLILFIKYTFFIIKAMEKAKEAYRKERLIIKQREEKNLTDQTNTELTGFVIKD